ncbi:MAG: ABC transporter substrate-binding protein [Bacteroidales bacterium]
MKRFIILLAGFCCLSHTALPQSTGKWKSCLAYYNTTAVAESDKYVYALADGSLYSYGKSDNSVNYYSKETGLNDNQITNISYNSAAKTLIIIYSNGNIDLLGADGVYNLPYLMNNSNIQDKTVYSVYNDNGTAYLSAAFGIVALNVGRKEIKETYKLSAAVLSAAVAGNDIYALTATGIFRGSLNDNLIDPAGWHDEPVVLPALENITIRQLCVFQGALCLLLEGEGIYFRSEDNGFQSLLTHTSLKNMKAENDRLVAFSSTELFIYESFTQSEHGSFNNINDVAFSNNDNTFWLAAGEAAVVGIKKSGADRYETIASGIINNGPKRNLDAFMVMRDRKLYIAGGGRWADRFYNRGTVMIYDTERGEWNNFGDISGFSDATSIAIDPEDDTHLFVSTWGEGVYEFKDGSVVTRYNHTNSTLSTIFPDAASQYNYIRVDGLCFDKDGNLWMTNSKVNNVIAVRKRDGAWTNLYYEPLSNAELVDKILIASNGHKWINLARAGDGGKSGVFVLDDKGTLDTADDAYHYYGFLSDAQGNIGASEYLCITEDKQGAIWIGTNRGVFIVSVPSLGVEGTMVGARILQPNETGQQDYFLKDERITAIAVDGGNRKWLGTGSSGIYLVSADGGEVIHHFTADNSPLLSDVIQSVAVDDYTGEVFIGTDKGLISYWSDATKASADYSDVYAFPNPVRPDFDDNVVITGLMEESNVKITDVKGNLIYQGKSAGGQLSWNVRNRNGKPVAPGVYLVFASTPAAKESVVTKIAVVR